MAEGSGRGESTFSFHRFSRNDEREFEDGSDDAEKNSFKPYFSLGKTRTAEKKVLAENHGSGKHSINLLTIVTIFRLWIIVVYE
jgi:hypothetical protein